jgi:hypothetical protein
MLSISPSLRALHSKVTALKEGCHPERSVLCAVKDLLHCYERGRDIFTAIPKKPNKLMVKLMHIRGIIKASTQRHLFRRSPA